MPHAHSNFGKFGGLCFVISGLLFLVKSTLEFMMGAPPTNGTEILDWVASRELLQAFTPEILFFAVGFMVPAVWALHESLAGKHPGLAATGSGIMALTISVLSVLLTVQGRLVYPVYDIKVHTPDIAELVVALYYGGVHVAALLFAAATLVLSIAMWRGAYGRSVAYLGFVTAAADVASSYPDRIGPVLTFLCAVLFAAWFVAVGWRLYQIATADQSDVLVPATGAMDERSAA